MHDESYDESQRKNEGAKTTQGRGLFTNLIHYIAMNVGWFLT
jgi:hypothetical protein